jgi:uncharacterized protein (TIGR02217 family)
VSVHTNASKTVRDAYTHSTHDWMRYSIHMNDLTDAQKVTLMAFVRGVKGNGDNFLFQDTYGWGYAVTKQTIATGDGATKTFQLLQTVGSTNYDRWDIINDGTLAVYVNDVLQTYTTHYTCDFTSSGVITFGSAPGNGLAVAAAFGFYRRCRFTGSFKNIYAAYAMNNMSLSFAEEGI